MKIDLSKVKKRTLLYIGLVCAGSAAAQQQWVRDHILAFGHAHPHWSFLAPTLVTVITILHNPQVAQIVSSLEQEETQKLPDGTVKTSTLTAITSETPSSNPSK